MPGCSVQVSAIDSPPPTPRPTGSAEADHQPRLQFTSAWKAVYSETLNVGGLSCSLSENLTSGGESISVQLQETRANVQTHVNGHRPDSYGQ